MHRRRRPCRRLRPHPCRRRPVPHNVDSSNTNAHSVWAVGETRHQLALQRHARGHDGPRTLRVYLDSRTRHTITVLERGINEYVWTIPSSLRGATPTRCACRTSTTAGSISTQSRRDRADARGPARRRRPRRRKFRPPPYSHHVADAHRSPPPEPTPVPSPRTSITPAPSPVPVPVPSTANSAPTLLPLPLPSPLPTPFCHVLSPEAGSAWTPGYTHEVRWEYFVRADAVHLELLENGTTPTAYLKISHPNTGSFEWAVPAEIEQTTYAIRITNAADTSDFVTSPQFAIFQTPAPSPVSTEAILAAASAVPATWDMLNEAVYAIGAFVVEEGFGAWIYRIQKADRAFNGGDGAHVTTGQFFFVGFAIADMMSDLTFGINAYRTEGTSTIGAAALGWLAFICLVNLCLYCTSTSNEGLA